MGSGFFTRRYFPRTEHSLSGRFLAYWQSHHGATLRGAPFCPPRRPPLDGSSGALTRHAASVTAPRPPASYPRSRCLQRADSSSRGSCQTVPRADSSSSARKSSWKWRSTSSTDV
jgi:hypothetical protein